MSKGLSGEGEFTLKQMLPVVVAQLKLSPTQTDSVSQTAWRICFLTVSCVGEWRSDYSTGLLPLSQLCSFIHFCWSSFSWNWRKRVQFRRNFTSAQFDLHLNTAQPVEFILFIYECHEEQPGNIHIKPGGQGFKMPTMNHRSCWVRDCSPLSLSDSNKNSRCSNPFFYKYNKFHFDHVCGNWHVLLDSSRSNTGFQLSVYFQNIKLIVITSP